MSFTLSGVFADAGALWRRDHDLLVRIGAVFLFLPALAGNLFLVLPDMPKDADQQAAMTALLNWYGANAHWLAGQFALQVFGCGAVLAVVLGPGRTTVGEALKRTLRLMPALALLWAMMLVLVGAGMLLLFVPGLYLLGRLFVAMPVLVAEPGRGPFEALAQGFRRTERRGWMLLLVDMMPALASLLVVMVVSGFAAGLPDSGAGQAARALFDAVISAVGALALLAQLLLQAAAYRLLTGARQGM